MKSKNTPGHSRDDKKKSTFHTVLSFLFAFLLAFALFGLSLIVTSGYILSKGYVNHCLDRSYIDGLMGTIHDDIEDYTLPTGIDLSVTKDLFPREKIEKDMRSYVDSTFKIRESTIDTADQEEQLKQNTLAFLKESGAPTEMVNPKESEKELDQESVDAYNAAVEDTYAAVDEYVSDIVEIYRKDLRITGLDYIVKAGNDYHRYFPFLVVIALLFGALNGFFCVKVHSLPHRGLRYLVYAFTGAALMSFAAPFALLVSGVLNRLTIQPSYFRDFIARYAKGAIWQMLLFAGLWFIIAFVVLAIVSSLRKKSMKRRHEGRHEHKSKEPEIPYEELEGNDSTDSNTADSNTAEDTESVEGTEE